MLTDLIKDVVRPPLRGERIVFIHIPKCGGNSLIHAIEDCFKPWRKTQRGSVVRLDEEAVRYARSATALPDAALRQALLGYALASGSARLVCGHYRLAREVFDRYAADWSFVTVLRHPVHRWLSHYHYNHNNPGPFHIELPIHDFVQTPLAGLLGSVLVRYLGDVGDDGEPLPPSAVDRAAANLERFALVGALEDLPGFVDGFELRFGRRLDVPRRNVNRTRPDDGELGGDPGLLRTIHELCAPDLELYGGLFPKLLEGRSADAA